MKCINITGGRAGSPPTLVSFVLQNLSTTFDSTMQLLMLQATLAPNFLKAFSKSHKICTL